MCFVAFYKQGGTRWLLSNRDEYRIRPAALVPNMEVSLNYSLLMPKDAKAGGTWIAVRNDGIAAVLLNGAEHAHVSRPPYRHSRGFVIPQIMRAISPEKEMENTSFDSLEPFTLVLSMPERLLSFRWDGHFLTIEQENEKLSPCWSSSTLYNGLQKLERKNYWENWANLQGSPNEKAFMHFAGSHAPGATDSWIKMKREGGLETISSSLIKITSHKAEMSYVAYPENILFSHSIPIDTIKHANKILETH